VFGKRRRPRKTVRDTNSAPRKAAATNAEANDIKAGDTLFSGRSGMDNRKGGLKPPVHFDCEFRWKSWLGGDAEVCAGCGGRSTRGRRGIIERELLEVLLDRGVGLLGGGQISGLEILSELAEECGDRVRLAR